MTRNSLQIAESMTDSLYLKNMPSALMQCLSCHRDAMKAIEAVVSDASSLRPQQDDESERPLTDSSDDDPDALADEGQLKCTWIPGQDLTLIVTQPHCACTTWWSCTLPFLEVQSQHPIHMPFTQSVALLGCSS
jgi:hypothetical protein